MDGPRKIGGYDIHRVKSVDEAAALYASYPALSESRVFADTAGKISWHLIGDAPVRKKGDGMLPARGWDPEYGWHEEPLPYEALPSAVGADDTRWAWGRARPVYLIHPVGTKAPLGRIWNRGPFAWGGDATTIPQGSIAIDRPLGNAVGLPNLRAVIDVGNWEASRYVLAGGQSGNPLSPHYDDMIDRWLRGESVSMAWSAESVRTRTRETLHLVPGDLCPS